MKKIITLILPMLLMSFDGAYVKAQMNSALVSFSPSSSTRIDDATRVGYHYGNWMNSYMRYDDASYLLDNMVAGLSQATPNFGVMPLPEDFVIKKFQKSFFYEGFIGSYAGVGMYGRLSAYPITPGSSFSFPIFKLPAVEQLDRVALTKLPTSASPFCRTKSFAIGQKAIPGTYGIQSYMALHKNA